MDRRSARPQARLANAARRTVGRRAAKCQRLSRGLEMTDSTLPHPLDRAALHDDLARHWAQPAGVRGWLSALDHKVIGRRYVVTALVFLALAGLGAVAMRLQL